MTEETVNVQEIQKQEGHLRSKYGNIDKRKGSAMLHKKLRGSSKKYFDSGDYNMERDRAVPKIQAGKVSNLVLTGKKPFFNIRLLSWRPDLKIRKFRFSTRKFRFFDF